jgi:hypothetical protein
MILKDNCLTVNMVLDIQRALRNGRPVGQIVAKLTQATLPGLMEYGCLRWVAREAIPALPEALVSSPVGMALQQVKSPLGLRADGPAQAPIRDSNWREFEFYVIEEPDDVTDNRFDEYVVRFEFGARAIGLPRSTAINLQAALHEMAANAVTHADSPVAALIGYEVRKGRATFCVVDVGIGVLKSLHKNPSYTHITVHSEAIRLALEDGVSSIRGDFTRGNGFRHIFKSLAEQFGTLRLRSGEGSVEMDGMDLDVDKGRERRSLPHLDGFQVAVSCRTRVPA